MTQTRKLILCRGIQGSGKSTYAKAWANKDPEHRVRYNNDDIRNMLGKYWVPSRESLISNFKDMFAETSMSNGYDIIVDNMNLNPKEVEYWQEKINSANKNTPYTYLMEFKDFFIPLEECIKRDKLRPNPIGETVIRSTYKKYRKFMSTVLVKQEFMRQSNIVSKPDLPDAVIVDLDGTLCLNLEGRPFYGEGTAEGIANDYPIEIVIDMVNSLRSSYDIIIVTGRENIPEIKKATIDWLFEHNVGWDDIRFRPTGDYSPSYLVKEDMLNHIQQEYNVKIAIEDEPKCVEMYRKKGIICMQPNSGLL